MSTLNQNMFRTPEELDTVIKEREAEAAMLPPGLCRQSVLVEVARLKSYADMKRLLADPAPTLN